MRTVCSTPVTLFQAQDAIDLMGSPVHSEPLQDRHRPRSCGRVNPAESARRTRVAPLAPRRNSAIESRVRVLLSSLEMGAGAQVDRRHGPVKLSSSSPFYQSLELRVSLLWAVSMASGLSSIRLLCAIVTGVGKIARRTYELPLYDVLRCYRSDQQLRARWHRLESTTCTFKPAQGPLHIVDEVGRAARGELCEPRD
ncbi:hypothetical protein BV20DRAFT_712174 [Pilatotrama ljubarskyi]|nr:hypothetical protein BV20DRAFT_712174 [Pilatotrama ljubarskyi]